MTCKQYTADKADKIHNWFIIHRTLLCGFLISYLKYSQFKQKYLLIYVTSHVGCMCKGLVWERKYLVLPCIDV